MSNQGLTSIYQFFVSDFPTSSAPTYPQLCQPASQPTSPFRADLSTKSTKSTNLFISIFNNPYSSVQPGHPILTLVSTYLYAPNAVLPRSSHLPQAAVTRYAVDKRYCTNFTLVLTVCTCLLHACWHVQTRTFSSAPASFI